MRYLTHLTIFGLLVALVLLSGCSAGRRAFSKGEDFEAKGMYEEAMYSYADAFRADPDVGDYRARFLKTRERAANDRFKRGNDLLGQGNYVDAVSEFQAAQALDPSQERFRQMAESTTRLKDAQLVYQEGVDFEKANKFKDAYRSYVRALELNPDNKECRAALARVSEMRTSRLEGRELSLKSAKPITIKFRDAKLKDVFNIVTQLSGIHFIFDEGVKDQPVTIFLENATFQQTLDLLTNMFKLGRKVLNESAVLIYPHTPDKVKQYEDMTLRTFHLSYMDTKKAINLIRSLIQVRKIYSNEDNNSLVVRDTANVVAVVEKILDANDVPEAEVLLDVEVLEISDRDTSSLGLLLSNYNVQLGAYNPNGQLMSNTLIPSTATTSSSTTTTATPTPIDVSTLLQAFKVKGYGGYITVPNATYNLGKTLSKGEVLSNPKIRVKNKEKSKFTVGTRVPITTTSTTGTTGGYSVNVQYVDVGVKVNAEPTIQLNNEVSIKLGLEVSSIASQQTVGGKDSPTTVVTISTKNLDTVLSLKDGETSVIGGLISKNQTSGKQKIFLLSDIPLIGPLLTSNDDDKQRSEVILAITPRIVRHVTVPPMNTMSFDSGKEDDPTLVKPMASFDLEPQFEAAPNGGAKLPAGAFAPPAPATQPAVQPLASPQMPMVPTVQPLKAPVMTPPLPAPAGSTSTVPAAAVSADVAKSPAPTAPTPTAQAAISAPAAPAAPAAPVAPVSSQPGLLQISAPSGISNGQPFNVEVRASNVNNLGTASMVLTYDPALVEFVSAQEGSFFNRDGKPTQFSSKADGAAGGMTVSLARGPGMGGVTGSGPLFTATFRARKPGSAGFGFRSATLSATDGMPLAMMLFSTAVIIK